MPKKKKEIKIDKSEWTPERFKRELLGPNNQNQPFTEENKAALYSLTREEALQLDPRIFARWRFYHEHKEMAGRGAKTTNRRKKELKDWSIKVRELLADQEIASLMLNQNKLPKWLNVLEEPTAGDIIIATLMAKAMTGDVRAVEELRKMGFGDKVTIDAGESFFNKQALKLEIVNPNEDTKKMEAKEFGVQQENTFTLPKSIQEQEHLPKEEPKSLPQANEIPGERIPQSLQDEFDRQEQERLIPISPSTVDSHGIDRSILNKVTITKNKNRQ